MQSLAAKHRNASSAPRRKIPPATAATTAFVPAQTVATACEERHESIIMTQFKADQHHMTHIKSRIKRTAIKRSTLTRYQEWLTAFMQKQSYTGDEARMFVWLTLWHLDVGDWQRGLELAGFALTEGMSAPNDFARTLAETVTEEMVSGILKEGTVTHHLDLLDALAQQINDYDMTDQITAKLYKARALARLDSDPEKARELLLMAAELDSKAGVKRYLKALEARKKPTTRKAENIQDYSLSARAAAKLANMAQPTFIRHAKKHPDLLPRLEIPVGTRHLYRFNPKHVKAYIARHMVNAT